MPATVQHSEQAQAVARETGWDLDAFAASHGWSAVALGPVGTSRDAAALETSNWRVVAQDLIGKFDEAVDTVVFGHWAVGWVEELASDAGRDDVQFAIQAWRDALADYPIANDEHFSELEWRAAVDTIRSCRSSYIERDGIEWELSELLPDDWAEQVYSAMADEGENTWPDGMHGEHVDDAAYALGFYVPEVPTVLLPD